MLAIIVGAVLFIVGGLGWLIAAVLEARISREMEFRADAEGARLASDTSGMVRLLEKIGHESGGLPAPPGATANPMFFRSALRKFWFDSHPPLVARIRALDAGRAAEIEAASLGHDTSGTGYPVVRRKQP
jgi:Zn-dependent protease with chaperone function